MKRIKNIDLLRAGAILYIMLYHCYVLSGQPWQAHTAIHTILTLGGEVGVTLFFLLSGYGIYLSLSSSEERGCLPGWRAFMKKRCIRIMPQYYVCVTVLLIFMSTQMFSNEGFRHILAYYTFTENFSPVTHGSINGALWTMGVIFQFYLIAPFLIKPSGKTGLYLPLCPFCLPLSAGLQLSGISMLPEFPIPPYISYMSVRYSPHWIILYWAWRLPHSGNMPETVYRKSVLHLDFLFLSQVPY